MNERFIESRLRQFEAQEAAVLESNVNNDMQLSILDRINCRRIQFLDMLDYPDCSTAMSTE